MSHLLLLSFWSSFGWWLIKHSSIWRMSMLMQNLGTPILFFIGGVTSPWTLKSVCCLFGWSVGWSFPKKAGNLHFKALIGALVIIWWRYKQFSGPSLFIIAFVAICMCRIKIYFINFSALSFPINHEYKFSRELREMEISRYNLAEKAKTLDGSPPKRPRFQSKIYSMSLAARRKDRKLLCTILLFRKCA